MRWKQIFRRKRWFIPIASILWPALWWFVREFATDTLMQSIRDYLTQQGRAVSILNYIWENPLIIVGIAAIGVFAWAYIDTKRELENKSDAIKIIDSAKITKMLEDMHKQMLELANKAYRKFIKEYKSKEFLALNNEFASAIPEYSSLTGLNESLKGKRLSKVKKRKRIQVDDIQNRINGAKPSHEWNITNLIEFTNLFNRIAMSPNKHYVSLDILRCNNKKWKKLNDELKNIKAQFRDIHLDKMIDQYPDWSYGCTGLILHAALIRWYIPPELLPTKYLESEAYNPDIELGNKMISLRDEITKRIDELQDEKRIVKQILKIQVKRCDILDYYPQPEGFMANVFGHHNIIEVVTEFYPKGDIRLRSIELHTGRHTFQAKTLPVIVVDRDASYSIEFEVPSKVIQYQMKTTDNYLRVLYNDVDCRSEKFPFNMAYEAEGKRYLIR